MTPGLSILVPVSDKGNEGPVLTFVVRGEYYFLALPASPRPLIFLFLPRLARPILSSLPISFSSAYPLSPSIVHRLTAASPRLASPRSPPFLSVSFFLRSTVSMPPRIDTASQGSKQGRYIRVDAVRQGFGNDPLRTLIYIHRNTQRISRIDTGSMFNRFRLLTYSDLSLSLSLSRGEREIRFHARRFVASTRSDTDNNNARRRRRSRISICFESFEFSYSKRNRGGKRR